MTSTYCTKDYDQLALSFYKRFTGENKYNGWNMNEAIKELDVFVRGYLSEKKRYDWWMSRPMIENPKNNKEVWYNVFWKQEHSDESLYAKGMKTQQNQFTAMEKAILMWLPESDMTEKEQNKVLKKIQTRKNKIF